MDDDALCVLGINPILDKVVSRKDPEHDPRQGPVLRAAMTFISARRSDDELKALRTKLMTCTCRPDIRATHHRVFRPMTDVLELALFEICSSITDYFMRIGAGKFLKVKENTPEDARPWPSSITDVIPAAGGERDVLLGLMQWATSAPGGHSVFALIGALARYWEPFALQVFEDGNLYRLATQHLQYALDKYRPNSNAGEQMSVFVTPVIAIAQGFFHTLSEVDMRVALSLLAPVYEEMYSIAVAIEPILLRVRTQMHMDDCRRWFHLVRSMRSVITPEGQWVLPANRPQMKGKIHFGVAFHRMTEIRNRNQCLHIECTTKIAQRSSVCSRCGIVRYCGQPCLAAAWDASNHPHKTLCKKITRLRASIGLADDKDWTRTVRDSAVHRSPQEFATMCERKGADSEEAEVIWRGIMSLTDARTSFIAQRLDAMPRLIFPNSAKALENVDVGDAHDDSQAVATDSDSSEGVESVDGVAPFEGISDPASILNTVKAALTMVEVSAAIKSLDSLD
ncbi:hypothetical protein DFH06DRAFT_1139965 [Mycena polygramma]|nr:hypothetical protein DFH06DRAFT_1139965 [Mycena polygramma]